MFENIADEDDPYVAGMEGAYSYWLASIFPLLGTSGIRSLKVINTNIDCFFISFETYNCDR